MSNYRCQWGCRCTRIPSMSPLTQWLPSAKQTEEPKHCKYWTMSSISTALMTKLNTFFLILTFNNRLYWSHKKAFLIHRPTSNNLRSTNYPRWHQHPRDCSRSIPCWSAENTSINNMLSFLTIQNFLKLSILVITLTSIVQNILQILLLLVLWSISVA